ncbi:MAG: aminodeoxychorismate synthase component I [Candidatus Omnitrophica bacterium]|nr:aminodeoxychorismate synthase component I [Candidatus Omnitrophota bacterium]
MAYSIWKSYKLDLDPLRILAALRGRTNPFLLDSSLNACKGMGRFSFLGSDPFYVLSVKKSDPFAKLRELLNRWKTAPAGNKIPFSGGAVGYLAYDLGFLFEPKLKQTRPDDLNIPDALFGFYNTVIAVDHSEKKVHIFCAGLPEKKPSLARKLCLKNLKKAEGLLGGGALQKREDVPHGPQARLRSNFRKAEYIAAVKSAKEYIRQGDIYQVNLTQRFQAKTCLSAFQLYRRLRDLSPTCFGAYFDTGPFQIISSSPERFLCQRNNLVSTRPMKGTRPRAESRDKDMRFRKELLASAKDKAELVMIVDLERNDLGKVCNYDSVRVKSLRELEEYRTVYQTTATVEGSLYKGKDRLDLLRACFPGGSITGCPKVRAMEIIEELEPNRRGIYTGSLGYLSFSGEMDFNILIRTILKKGRDIYFGAGGGIVADSVPEKEYAETLVKAKAMIEAIQ